jgi:hypothetical protein
MTARRRELRAQPWSEFRDTFMVTLPSTSITVEPGVAGPGSTISMLIPATHRRSAIEALRGLVNELEDMEPTW